MAAWIVDEDGERRRFLVKGFDRISPDKMTSGTIEIRRGGMCVFHLVDDRPMSVAPPPLAPALSAAELQEAREARAVAGAEQEREAAQNERVAAEEVAKKRAAERKASTTA